jgi:hypothetical protein
MLTEVEAAIGDAINETNKIKHTDDSSKASILFINLDDSRYSNTKRLCQDPYTKIGQ